MNKINQFLFSGVLKFFYKKEQAYAFRIGYYCGYADGYEGKRFRVETTGKEIPAGYTPDEFMQKVREISDAHALETIREMVTSKVFNMSNKDLDKLNQWSKDLEDKHKKRMKENENNNNG